MVFEHRSYRDYLKDLLVSKQKKNPSYSLRTFAGALGFSSSQLSEVLNGKANFSGRSLRKIALQLKLTARETHYLCTLGEFESEKEPAVREKLLDKLRQFSPRRANFTDVAVDQFKQMADWKHSALLELPLLKGFKLTPATAAKKLGISRLEAEVALDRLHRLALFAKNKQHEFVRTGEALQVRSINKNAAMREFYREMLNKASSALESQTPEERWSGFETIPVAKESLPEIHAACGRFFDEVLQIAAKHESKTGVYHLLTHFFNLTHEEEKP